MIKQTFWTICNALWGKKYFENVPSCLHPHTYVHKASTSQTEGKACRKVLSIKCCLLTCSWASGLLPGQRWFTLCQTDEPERQAISGLGHTGQSRGRLHLLTGSNTFAWWDVWTNRVSTCSHLLPPHCLDWEEGFHKQMFWNHHANTLKRLMEMLNGTIDDLEYWVMHTFSRLLLQSEFSEYHMIHPSWTWKSCRPTSLLSFKRASNFRFSLKPHISS